MNVPHEKHNEMEVLEATMETFWNQGFNATSYDDLVKATGLERQNLYRAFGDKTSLYQKSLKHYSDFVTQQSIDILAGSGSPIGKIKRWLNRLRNHNCSLRNGCLLTNAVMELAPHEPEILELVSFELNRVECSLKSTIEHAVGLKDLPENTEIAATATFLLGVAQGLIVLSRSGISAEKLNDFTDIALSTLENRS